MCVSLTRLRLDSSVNNTSWSVRKKVAKSSGQVYCRASLSMRRTAFVAEVGRRDLGQVADIYKELSPNSILVSGGQTTVANLFYNLARRQIGLVGLWDVVAFDEVAGIHFKDHDGVQIMKDYSFRRGCASTSRTSLCAMSGSGSSRKTTISPVDPCRL